MEKVIALVVSHNRQQLLQECIYALHSQTRKPDAILVMNNGSTDNTAVWLDSQPDLFHITQQNVGSAGGFHIGINWAYKNGYAWIWCMDDDGYPAPDALEVLLKHEGHERTLLNCAVIDKQDRKSFVWDTKNYSSIDEVKEDVIEGIGHPFNGTLIHRTIIAKVGTPKAQLFLWGDETEYYYRIVKRYQIPVKTITRSVHYHPASAYTYKNDWDCKSSWKMYYYVRNRFQILQSKCANKPLALAHYIAFIIAFSGLVVLFQKTDKLRKLNFIIWPMVDALKGNYKATPQTILMKMQAQQALSFSALFLAPIKTLYYNIFFPRMDNGSKTATA
jgi:GT2 family glycosyltransferase